LIELENVTPITAYFKHQLIANDPADDKFVNCAIAANALYIVTHDSHFNILKETACQNS
jgi:predicted nucleic acid-binding protein